MPFRSDTMPNAVYSSAAEDEESGQEDDDARMIRLSRGEVRPNLYTDICGLCGRTLLMGESPELFFEPHGVKPVVVCPVCRTQARDSGYSKAS